MIFKVDPVDHIESILKIYDMQNKQTLLSENKEMNNSELSSDDGSSSEGNIHDESIMQMD